MNEDQLKDFYIKQDDLNRLIMDYLVNGKQKIWYFAIFKDFDDSLSRGSQTLQKDLKKLPKSSRRSQESWARSTCLH